MSHQQPETPRAAPGARNGDEPSTSTPTPAPYVHVNADHNGGEQMRQRRPMPPLGRWPREQQPYNYRQALEHLPELADVEPNADAPITPEQPPAFGSRGGRWLARRQVRGRRADVAAWVAYLLATDTCTQCYEHMLFRLDRVVELGDGEIRAELSASLYAGD